MPHWVYTGEAPQAWDIIICHRLTGTVREMHIAMRIEYIVQTGKSIFNFLSKPKFVALEWESILQHL